jgi:acetyl-CoA carboxylase carboxyltransferase component
VIDEVISPQRTRRRLAEAFAAAHRKRHIIDRHQIAVAPAQMIDLHHKI